jgi:4-amino-4-deoxy-L-arabinose transferase-like glycosyltransferase
MAIGSEEPRDPHGPWRGALWLAAVLALVVYVYPLLLAARIPLTDPDEGLHASIAQEMVRRGDWVVPRLMGEPFLDKPILYFWAETASLRAFGMSEWAVRLPGLLFGLLGMLATGIAGRRMFGRPTGVVAAMFYATMFIPTALVQSPTHDVALVPLVTLAILLFWEAEQAQSRRAAAGYTLAIGLLLGLSILTKGLVGVALVGIAYGGYLLLGRRLTVAICARGAAVLLVAAAIGGTWFIAMEVHNPGFLHYYFIDRHLKGFATATQSHGLQPWWYYLPFLLGGGLPWIAYLPVVIRDQWATRGTADPSLRRPGSPLLLLWCWVVGCALVLSISHSKLVTYLWPVFPAVAILAAVAWTRLWDGALSQGARRLLGFTLWLSCLTGPAVLPAVLAAARWKIDLRLPWTVWAVGVAISLTAAAPLAFWLAGRYRAVLATALLTLAAQFVFLVTAALPQAAEGFSARELAGYLNQREVLPSSVLVVEERLGSLGFYLNNRPGAGPNEPRLQSIRFAEVFDPRVVGPRAVVVLPEGKARAGAKRGDKLSGIPYQRVGHYRVYSGEELLGRGGGG